MSAESYPPMSSCTDIMSISAEQALYYFHQSLVSLISLRESITKRKQLCPESPLYADKQFNEAGCHGSDYRQLSDGKISKNENDASSGGESGQDGSECDGFPAADGAKSEPLDLTGISPLVITTKQLPTKDGQKDESKDDKARKNALLLSEAAEVAAIVLEAARGTMMTDRNGKILDPASIHRSSPGDSRQASASPSNTYLETPVDDHLAEEQRYAIARRFWSKTAPEITIWKYLQRLHKYCPTSAAVYLAAGVYIYRLCIILQMIPLTELSVHRLVLASIRVACKNLEDAVHPQARYATAAGVSITDLYRLEIALLFILDFDIKVDAQSLRTALVTWAEVQVQSNRLAMSDLPQTPESVS